MTNVVLACYFNYKNDPQRNIIWNNDYSDLLLLISSVITQDIEIKIFHNCFKKIPNIRNCEWIRIDPDLELSPNVFRYFVYKNYLENNYASNVFMVDSTDVMMLKNPFPYIEKDKLYSGYEKTRVVSHRWMKKTQGIFLTIPDYSEVISKYSDRDLLNCGIIGGNILIVKDFLNTITYYHDLYSRNLTSSSDMSVFNYTVYKHYEPKLVYGDRINTEFKKYQYNNEAWWKHK